MAAHRELLRSGAPTRPPSATRRLVRAAAPVRDGATEPAHAALQLQRRLGNQATQALLARSDLVGGVPNVALKVPVSPVAAGTVSLPSVARAGPEPYAATSGSHASSLASPKLRGARLPDEPKSPQAEPAKPDGTGAAPHPTPKAAEEQGVKPGEKPAAAAQAAKPGTASQEPRGAGGVAEANAGPSPRQAIAPAAAAVRQRAAAARRHPAPGAPVASAQAAAVTPKTEQERAAGVKTVANLDAAEVEKVRRAEFKTKLRKAIEAATPLPKTEAEAEKVAKSGGTTASGALRGELAGEREGAAGPMKSATAIEAAASDQPVEPASTLIVQPSGPAPAPVSASPVVPAPLPPRRLDYSADRAPTNQLMTENKVSTEQLKKGNDPAFGPTLNARSTAEKHEAGAEVKYRLEEGKIQGDTQATAQAVLAQGLGGIHVDRVAQLGKVADQQHGTVTKDAAQRKQITGDITAIKNKTKADVEKILDGMETEALTIFEGGLKKAETAYDAAFDEAKGGVGTWLTTWGDDWKKHIEGALTTARSVYMYEVNGAIDRVADFIDSKVKEAKDRVTAGRKEIDVKVEGLGADLRKVGEDARDAVSGDFDAMITQIDERQNGLIDKLAEKYKESYDRMSAREEELREANKSLWERVYDATVGLVKKIIAFKDMLLGLLGRAANVVEEIIADPIGFLGNLVSGVMQGLKNFMSNIGGHLKKGLMDWLFGALAGVGLQLPDSFDLKGIVSIVLQVLGLTYANFRARAVAIVGEPVVGALEKAAEVFKVFVTEGIPGLWRFIKEKVADLKAMVLDAIFDFIKEKVIIAGITWIIGLLNPASAFFRACKAIYDIVMFFINRGSQILSLVNAIIDSMASIVKGNISVAATFVENALAKAVPVAIGFLASLLGLGDPSKPVRNTIEKAQSPVNKAIDWVIHGAVKVIKAAGKFIGKAFGKKDEPDRRTDMERQQDLAAAVTEGTEVLKDKSVALEAIPAALEKVRVRHRLAKLALVIDERSSGRELGHLDAQINPRLVGKTVPVVDAGDVETNSEESTRSSPPIIDPSRLLGAGRATTKTLRQVQNLKGTGKERGTAAEVHEQEMSGGEREIAEETALGGRRHDLRDTQRGRVEVAKEIKNYKTWITVKGKRVRKEVLLTPKLLSQIDKDTLWRRDGKKLTPPVEREVIWIFYGAPPSPDLLQYLLARNFLIVMHT